MSKSTTIQWSDSTINPVMGCSGCELFPAPDVILRDIHTRLKEHGFNIDIRSILRPLIHSAFLEIPDPAVGHRDSITTTNIHHFRESLADAVTKLCGRAAGNVVREVIRSSLKCYAAKLHLNRCANLLKPGRSIKKGYAPSFEQVTNFEGRMMEAAGWADLLGTRGHEAPWKSGLPRMVFISDMGDALCSSGAKQFAFLKREVIDAVTSPAGRRHIWLWLTKRPRHMEAFAESVGGFPRNLCAMTTVTGVDTLHRVDELRQVRAACRGLSVEPLWESLPADMLDLTGIDWLIIGGESGAGEFTRPFHLEWVEELMKHCRKHKVAIFVKQLGRNPVHKGKPVRLRDPHGGDWSEWPAHLRVREFPGCFYEYRRTAVASGKPIRHS